MPKPVSRSLLSQVEQEALRREIEAAPGPRFAVVYTLNNGNRVLDSVHADRWTGIETVRALELAVQRFELVATEPGLVAVAIYPLQKLELCGPLVTAVHAKPNYEIRFDQHDKPLGAALGGLINGFGSDWF